MKTDTVNFRRVLFVLAFFGFFSLHSYFQVVKDINNAYSASVPPLKQISYVFFLFYIGIFKIFGSLTISVEPILKPYTKSSTKPKFDVSHVHKTTQNAFSTEIVREPEVLDNTSAAANNYFRTLELNPIYSVYLNYHF